MFSRFRRNDHTHSDIHDYIRRALEKNDHGRNRVLVCDAKTLNDALEKHLQLIGEILLFFVLPSRPLIPASPLYTS